MSINYYINAIEFNNYIFRPELKNLDAHSIKLLYRYCRMWNGAYPIGRLLAYGLMKYNKKAEIKINDDFINWLYTY